MKRLLFTTLLLLIAGPSDLSAERSHSRTHHGIGARSHVNPYSQDIRNRTKNPTRSSVQNSRRAIKLPSRLPVHPGSPGKPGHPVYPGLKPGKPGHGRPGYWWPSRTTVVRETQPIIIVNYPPPIAPPPTPEPEKMWVPPVMETRTEPGYWDFGIKKMWMGDHWRYEQDHEKRIWVPASPVKVVKQEGYWKTVE